MVVVDQLSKDGWCHLASPDLVLVEKFVGSMGLRNRRFDRSKHGRIPHFDLRGDERELALKYGAIPVNSKTLVKYMLTSDRDVVFDFLGVKGEVFKEMFKVAFNQFKVGHHSMVPRMIPGMTTSKAEKLFSSRPGDEDFVWKLANPDGTPVSEEEYLEAGWSSAPFPYPFPLPENRTVSVEYRCQRCGHQNSSVPDLRSVVTCEKCRFEEFVEINFEENE